MVIDLTGDFRRYDRVIEVCLERDAMQLLAQSLKNAVEQRQLLSLNLRDKYITFATGLEVGEASRPTDDSLIIRSNWHDLSALSEDLLTLASASIEEDCLPHIHLEPYYINSNATVKDIVFTCSL